jgi:uncharacterized membrane protein
MYVEESYVCILYIYLSPKHHFQQEISMIQVVEEIKLLLLLGNRMVVTSRLATVGQTYPHKHVRGNVRYLVIWNIKQFTVGYFPRLAFVIVVYVRLSRGCTFT